MSRDRTKKRRAARRRRQKYQWPAPRSYRASWDEFYQKLMLFVLAYLRLTKDYRVDMKQVIK